MTIYQYTNIEALAYILKNRTIRFHRLDKVDDVEEGNAESLGVKFCKYIFVSCWTEVEEENIPLWKMYGGNKEGVRIGLEQKMFKEYSVPFVEGGQAKIPLKDWKNPDFFFLPNMNYDNEFFYRKIEYVDDVYSYTKDAIQERNNMIYNIETGKFGRYKHKRWEFQNESRFVLYAFPVNPYINGNKPNISAIVAQSFKNNMPLPFEDYYMYINDEAFENMEITLSPLATDAQRIIVECLKERYAPKAQIKSSSLGKLVRLK